MEEIKRDTPIDVFNGILKLARESGNFREIDEILDYAEASSYSESGKRPISNCEFQTTFEVDFGGSEGIYIDVFLVGSLDERGKHEHVNFGTLKTLEDDLHGMEIMGKACGILQYYAHEYFSQNWRKFEPLPKEREAAI